MTTGHLLMGLLAAGDRHGYDLKKAHDAQFAGSKPLAFGQVYATLERLAKKRHIAPVDIERVDGPDRTIFRLTPDGREELDRWLQEIEPPAPHVANPLAVKATLALLVGDRAQATRYLSDQRAAHLDRMRHYTRVKTHPDTGLAEVLAADYALAHLDADLQWLDLALERITALDVAITANATADESNTTTGTPAGSNPARSTMALPEK